MPEGPEVAVIVNFLSTVYVGKTLVGLSYDANSRYAKSGWTSHTQFLDRLPQKVNKIWSRGKKIVWELEDLAIVFSLGMEGKFKVQPTKHSNLWFSFGEIVGTTALISDTLYFDDTRHFGTVELILSLTDCTQRLQELELDILTDTISSETWRDRIRRKKWMNKCIADVLLDQNLIAGIGNYLRAEILYACRINPFRLVITLSDDELDDILLQAKIITRRSLECQGATIYTFESVDGGKGHFKMKVYNKSTDELGNEVSKSPTAGGRMIHWVPTIQV